jgi:hypothetical protein
MRAIVAHKHDSIKHMIEEECLLDPVGTYAMKVAGAWAGSLDCEDLSVLSGLPDLRLDSAPVAGSCPAGENAAFNPGTCKRPARSSLRINALFNLAGRLRKQQVAGVFLFACCRLT